MSDNQGNSDPSPVAVASSLPPAAIKLAMRMYNAAREGNIELLQQAILAGLPANMTNEKGDTLVCDVLGAHMMTPVHHSKLPQICPL